MPDSIVLLAEPLLREEFTQARVVVPLARALARWFDVTVAAPAMGSSVRTRLEEGGVHALDAGMWFPTPRHARDEAVSFVLSWAREAALALNTRWTTRRLGRPRPLRVNFSMTNTAPSDLWYLQSRPLGPSLRLVLPNFRPGLRGATTAIEPVVRLLDAYRFGAGVRGSGTLLTNCEYLVAWYAARGYRLAGSIPEFLQLTDFAPSTSSPRRDYALVYLGKETDIDAVIDLVRSGVRVKAFGGKTADWVTGRLGTNRPANLEVCGRVSHEELVNLYTHARFTAFPFTDEPFGLVPIESMACGTPVLSYAMQGPGETILDGETGWLVRDRPTFVARGRALFGEELPAAMPAACIRRAHRYGLESIAHEWERAIRAQLDAPPGPEGPHSVRPTG